MPGVFGPLYETETAANADYNSLQVTFTRRMAHGFSLLANYTYSKAIDIEDDEPTGPASVTFANSNNLAADRAVASFSAPDAVSLSWVWQAPTISRWGRIGREAVGGWQLDGIMTARTGQPVNVLSGKDTNLDGNSTDRPDLVSNPTLSGGRSRAGLINEFFNVAAFAPAAGLYGTAGRNVLYGPGSLNWNLSAFKEFQIHEAQKLQFRTDFFNALNQVNLGNPNGTLTSPSFGKITSAASPRVLQFGLKFLF
jgi:hypothetical protein